MRATRCTATRTRCSRIYAAADESTALDGVNQSTHVMLSVAQGITITETDDVTAEAAAVYHRGCLQQAGL